jgi:hypothetical protein
VGPATESGAGAGIKRKRIPEIDFWRGFALIVILIDHVPRNGLDRLTPKNFGFSDAAEAFIFLSGVSVSLAYAPKLQNAASGVSSNDARPAPLNFTLSKSRSSPAASRSRLPPPKSWAMKA